MTEDVRELIAHERIDDLPYREYGSQQRGSDARRRWPLIAASDRMLADRAEPRSPAKRAESVASLFDSVGG